MLQFRDAPGTTLPLQQQLAWGPAPRRAFLGRLRGRARRHVRNAMAHLVESQFLLRANGALVFGFAAACAVAAIVVDVARWFTAW